MHAHGQKDRSTLIIVIDAVIKALLNNSCYHNWSHLKSDNVGLLAQAITGQTPDDLFNNYIDGMLDNYSSTNPHINKVHPSAQFQTNWLGLIKSYWPLHGAPTKGLFNTMVYAGLDRQDIVDLEWLSNQKILQRAGILKKDLLCDVETIELKGFFKKKYVYKTVRKQLHYYEATINLLKYLEAWRDILEEEQIPTHAGIIIYDDDEYPFNTIEDLINLKQTFIERDQYEAIKKVDKEIEKLEKLNKK